MAGEYLFPNTILHMHGVGSQRPAVSKAAAGYVYVNYNQYLYQQNRNMVQSLTFKIVY
jgi:hypothetical protein